MYSLCFYWQIHNSSHTSSSTWKWNDIKLMDNLQKHTHSDYCHRNKSCHFGFPKPPATKTLISQPPIDDHDKIMDNTKSLLQTVQNTLKTAYVHHKSTQQVQQEINLAVETYMDALKISQRGPNVILKQSHKMFL